MKDQIKHTLTAMRERIERGWTQYAPARDIAGQIVLDHSKAEFICLDVALRQVQPDCDVMNATNDYLVAYIRANLTPQYHTLIGFNDDRETTKASVLAAIDGAIASLEEHKHSEYQ